MGNRRLGENIQTLRKKAGLTQEELAEMADVATRVLQRIESGQANPKIQTVSAIAESLKATLGDLFRDSESSAGEPEISLPTLQTLAKKPEKTDQLDSCVVLYRLFLRAPIRVRSFCLWALTGRDGLISREDLKALLAKAN